MRGTHIKVDNKKEIKEIAELILSNRIEIIIGIRRIVGKIYLDIKNEDNGWDFLTYLIAVSSETEHFLFGEARKNADANYLKRIDLEREKYIQQEKEQIVKICERIIGKYNSERLKND